MTFDGGVDPTQEWTVEDTLPTDLWYSLPSEDKVLLSIDEVENENDTTLVFHFGTDPQVDSYQFEIEACYLTAQEEGTTFTNSATLLQGESEIATAQCEAVVYDTPLEYTVSEDAQYYAQMGEPMQIRQYFKNSANRALTDFEVVITYAPYYNVTAVKASCPLEEVASYQIYLKTSDDLEAEVQIADCTSGASGIIDLTPYLTGENKVTNIILRADEVNSVTATNTSEIWSYGTVTSEDTTDNNTVFLLTAESENGWERGEMSSVYLIRETSVLTVEGSFPDHVDAVEPGEEVLCEMVAPENSEWRRNPIFVQHFPVGVEYQPENTYYIYTDGFQETTYDSREENFPIALPEVTIVSDVESAGRTLVRYDFTGFVLRSFNTLAVMDKVKINLVEDERFTYQCYLGNPTTELIKVGSHIEDTLDFDGDGITDENISASTAVNYVVDTTGSEYTTEKSVKGDLDTDFSVEGYDTPGGTILYNLEVTNISEYNLKEIQVVDILPYVGDTQILTPTQSRGSQYNVFPTEAYTVEIVDALTGEVEPEQAYSITYSTSHDPVRFDATGTGTIGTGTWSGTPQDFSTIGAIKVRFLTGQLLKVNQKLVITLTCATPIGVPVGETAYNSFAVLATRVTDLEDDTLQPTESANISVTTANESPEPPTPEPGTIDQAITDVITSVALEQTALAAILDAEGAKIQKAVALDLSTTELLAVNTSVESLVVTITTLEKTLQSKLATLLGDTDETAT